jgi:hypothetical protein
LAFWAGILSSVHSQVRTITQASLRVSASDFTETKLNGHLLVSQDPYLKVADRTITRDLYTDELCFFSTKNVLTLRYQNDVGSKETIGENNKVGVVYVLELTFSDGKKMVMTSGDPGQHRSFRTGKEPNPDPDGWESLDFNDGDWQAAVLSPPFTENTPKFQDPNTGKDVPYLLAFDDVNYQQKDRRLFRRKFTLDIGPAPWCPRSPTPTFTPHPSPTPRPTATPSFTPRPLPTVAPTYTPRPRPTSTPTPVPALRPKPTATPVPRKKKVVLVATPTVYVPPTPTDTPIRRIKWRPTSTHTPKPEPTDTPQPMRAASSPETIVFVNPPVNIQVSFADGPGRYRLEVQGQDGTSLKMLYDKRVTFDREAWITWDGTNEDGKLMPLGTYNAVFSKDGKVLKKIALQWIKENDD